MLIRPKENNDYLLKKFIKNSAAIDYKMIKPLVKNFKCDICKSKFISRTELKSHAKRHKEKNLKEWETLQSPIEFAAHTAEVHEQGSAVQCKNCANTYSQPDHLKDHVQRMHEELPSNAEQSL